MSIFMVKYIKNEYYTTVHDEKEKGTIHSYSVLFIDREYFGRKETMYHYNSSYHSDYGFSGASFESKGLLPDDIAKKRLLEIYKNTKYISQPHSNN